MKAFLNCSGPALNVQKYRRMYIFVRGCEGGLEVIVSIFQKDDLSTKAQYSPLSICLYKTINTFSKFNFKMNTSRYLLLFQDKFQNTFQSIRLFYLEKFQHGFILENKSKNKNKWRLGIQR